MKKVVIAVDSFKGTMSSIEVCSCIETGFKAILPEIETVKVPIADGGEGTVDTFLTALGGEKIKVTVKDPLFREVESFYGILYDRKTAVIEMAAASGLPLVEEEKNPCLTSTYGTGELIIDALNRGCNKLIIGIGGSATNDGGIGMAAALGVKFLDQDGNSIALNGEGLSQLRRIDQSEKDPRLDQCQVLVACDVDNPLYGEHGAAYVFAPQKGADPPWSRIDQTSKTTRAILKDLGLSVQEIAGAGAAGGLGAGLVAFTSAQLKPGIEMILDAVKFSALIADADLVITGEGKIDGQSLRGKVPIGIADRARDSGVPVIAIVGDVGDGIEAIYQRGISAVFSTNRVAVSFSEARLRANRDLLETSEAIARLFKIAGW